MTTPPARPRAGVRSISPTTEDSVAGVSSSPAGSALDRRLAVLALAAVAALAVAVALVVVQPFQAGPVDYDTGSSVIHFMRLVSGQRLEAFIGTTPKPLLTLIDGLLYAATGDWRAISWATIGASGTGIALATWLAWRIAGPIAAVVAAVALIASPSLLGEVIIASAVPWALIGWAVAGLAVTAARPHFRLAGGALLLAALARLETLLIVGLALVVLVILWAWGRRDRRRQVPVGAWWVLVGFGALPIMLVHDWLLTGDPFFWASVSARYSAGLPDAVIGPLTLLRALLVRYRGLLGMDVLALVGVVVARRSWPLWLGLAALGPGLVVFLFLLSFRGVYVAPRYAVPIDLVVLFTGAVGAAGVVEAVVDWWRRRDGGPSGVARRPRAVAAIAVAAGLATLLVGWPPAPLAAATQATARQALALARDERAATVTVRPILATIADADRVTPAPGSRHVVVLVPVPMRTLMAVDLGLPLTRVGSTSAADLAPAAGLLALTDLVVHDRAGDAASPAYAALEHAVVTTQGGETLTPLLVDPWAGLWIYAVTGP